MGGWGRDEGNLRRKEMSIKGGTTSGRREE